MGSRYEDALAAKDLIIENFKNQNAVLLEHNKSLKDKLDRTDTQGKSTPPPYLQAYTTMGADRMLKPVNLSTTVEAESMEASAIERLEAKLLVYKQEIVFLSEENKLLREKHV
eukprot:Selendium_serpulae@DN5337_c0_g2_i2.p1